MSIHVVSDFVMQVMNTQMAQSSRLGGHMDAVHDAMLPFTIQAKPATASDLHILAQLSTEGNLFDARSHVPVTCTFSGMQDRPKAR